MRFRDNFLVFIKLKAVFCYFIRLTIQWLLLFKDFFVIEHNFINQ